MLADPWVVRLSFYITIDDLASAPHGLDSTSVVAVDEHGGAAAASSHLLDLANDGVAHHQAALLARGRPGQSGSRMVAGRSTIGVEGGRGLVHFVIGVEGGRGLVHFV
ncbi:hypothetical protein BE08_46010 [Sorangium cellulosum]|uniref:Uncharacterized protein n=1 Tax=Sorangium cellulosum TaxID=56 RepID=A0A150P8D1_SORCE|nr:hypothetical protein BE08_46010 [Sorangium cellulosum]